MTFEVRAFEARTTSWWYHRRHEIDFNPPYQRQGAVWDRGRQSFLIDSIVNGFDIPKLYLADFTYFASALNLTQSRFAVIDGKQRLTAVFEFLEDIVPLAADFVLHEDPDAALAGLYYSDLRRVAPEISTRVENFNLPVMSVITDDERAVQELFVRLNSGKPLTAAERRNAMGGVVPARVREILSSQLFQECVAFSDRGAAHAQAAAKLLLLELAGGPVDLKRTQLDELYRRGEEGYEVLAVDSAAVVVMETATLMAQSFHARDPLLRSAGQLPVYYLLFRGGELPEDIRSRIELFHGLRPTVRAILGGAYPRSPLPGEVVADVSRYSDRMRNPNDARSVYEMYEIISWFVHVQYSALTSVENRDG